jgi:hypothetical protein
MGLARLGHDVYFIEDSDDYPSCYNPSRNLTDTDPSYGLTFADRVMKKIGFADRWAYFNGHTSQWLGPSANKAQAICKTADMVLNICGINPLRPWLLKAPVRILIDEDPAFNQIRFMTDPESRKRAFQHNAFFSFGENIGQADCSIPDDGIPWKPTRQPIVLDEISVTPGPPEGMFTTIMKWESYPSRHYQGIHYGTKSDSFSPFLDLPASAGSNLELGIVGPIKLKEELAEKGWLTRDPLEISSDPWIYLQYIRDSKAEFSVAKHGYVMTRSGWFSERSLFYLASGRPVVVQETGFSDWLNRAGGVIAFCNPEEALEGIQEINRRYSFHCRAAREVAGDYFDSRKVLSSLLDRALHFSTPALEAVKDSSS